MMRLDHMLLEVDDVQVTLDFYMKVLGFTDGGPDGPFHMLRVNADTVLVLAPRHTPALVHLAFAMERDEFDAALGRIKAANVEYGDAFDKVGNNQGPAAESGAHGKTKSVYLYDPDKNLIEICYYEPVAA